MSRKGLSEFAIATIATVVLFLVGSLIVFIVVYNGINSMSTGFTDSLCSFSVFMRSAIFGNPLIELLVGAADYIGGSFLPVSSSAIALPLPCESGPSLRAMPNNPASVNNLLEKIARESARCWDMFGQGDLDSLLFGPEGQAFTCWKDTVTFRCDGQFNSSTDLYNYLRSHDLQLGSYSMRYADYLPTGLPVLRTITGLDRPICGRAVDPDNPPETYTYLFMLYFVDHISSMFSVGQSMVSTVCETVPVRSLDTDSLYLCAINVTGVGGVS